MFYLSNKKGFTLIELLVVISIIGLLSSVVLASLSVAKQKANDSKRKQDLQQYKTAMEIYYSNHGTYFISNAGHGTYPGWAGGNCKYSGRLSFNEALIADGALGGSIIGPKGTCNEYLFDTRPNNWLAGYGVLYFILTNLERPTSQDAIIYADRKCNLSGYSDTEYNWCVSVRKDGNF